ncbi:7-cyano-7-deazaguanine synthase [Candidatus Woesearchaeota archaeon]|nr:7-cyano-7-deazaguanine synthase [Candidatus Woesearchaeota archaeon]
MKAISLISDGIDSPAATAIMLEKGLEIIGVHFADLDKKSVEKAKRLCKKIGLKKLYIINHDVNKKGMLKNCPSKYVCVLCKRMMLRIAEKIAEKENCEVLVTGENLGQVASQTLENMQVTDSCVKIPIIRPLLCNDKVETVKIANKIGTYDISAEPSIGCTAVPKHPITKSKIGYIEELEKNLNIEGMIADSIKTAEVVEIR